MLESKLKKTCNLNIGHGQSENRLKNTLGFSKGEMMDRLGVLAALIILVVVMTIFAPNFATTSNIFGILQQIAVIGIISVGMTFVILLGGIDLSVGSIVAFTGLVIGLCMKAGLAIPVALLVGIVIGAVIGWLNGFLISKIKLQPFVATLGTMTMVRGMAYTITNGQPVYQLPTAFTDLAGFIGPVPKPVIIMAIVFAFGAYTLKYTRFGRHMFAIGGNRVASKLSGINVTKNEILVYITSGMCCALAAILLTARMGSAVATAADGYELDAIAAVAIGGTSMLGGKGTILGTLIGALIIGVIANGLNLLDVQQGPQRFVKGIIIILAVVIEEIRKKKEA
ncbi:ribose transport system permease protein [Sporomusaceae bacterium BoRhaA]|uniref:ABC transporter permease n=1 Tax=Pelorhabdus rhamnosifermentans TaxID=2772457 RepID=UPI001C05FFB2|nr:ribose ABC transporter permease [Pelorhabdus rhamnosifermentans]MBU2702746.1 ribose transport system permease protein [Pelorhabdus rhamnosifermentans]